MDPRFSRMARLPQIGEDGRAALARSHVAVVGCGALGSHAAEALARSGVGELTLIDRDVVEASNLDRQCLYDEEDAARGEAKAVAAARRLERIHSGTRCRPVVADLDHLSVAGALSGASIVLDGTDNFSTRLLVNDWCVREQVPWVHAAVIGVYGQVLPILPGGPCYRCFLGEEPPPGTAETCDVAGVLPTAVAVVAALAVTDAYRILLDRPPPTRLRTVQVWEGRFESLSVPRREDCPACAGRNFEYLTGRRGMAPARLCGGGAVQIRPRGSGEPDLTELARRLEGNVLNASEFLLRFEAEGKILSLFRDGRAIVHGTDDPAEARILYTRYVGL